MGRYFESFEEAWDAFLERDEPLEDFFDRFPAEEFEHGGWLLVPSPEVKRAVLPLQGELERFEWLRLVPHHFLHVWLSPLDAAELDGIGPVDVVYEGVNCFHDAVVVEVDGPKLHALDPRPTFLPHMTLAITTHPAPADELRGVLEPLRETFLGRQRVEEAIRVSFPFSRERLFEPWTVRERMSLGR